MNTTNTYLKFKDAAGNYKLVSIDSILNGGYPIDAENGEDLELVSDELLNIDSEPLCSDDF